MLFRLALECGADPTTLHQEPEPSYELDGKLAELKRALEERDREFTLEEMRGW